MLNSYLYGLKYDYIKNFKRYTNTNKIMKIALVDAYPQDTLLFSKIKKILDDSYIQIINLTEKNYDLANQVDLIFIVGGDRAMLDYFHKVVSDSAPAIGIYESESTGFLAQIDVRDLETNIQRLKKMIIKLTSLLD